MSRIFWDTNLFIYLLEGGDSRAARVREIRTAIIRRRDHLFTSAMTLGEVLVKPQERGDKRLIARYEHVFSSEVFILSFGISEAKTFSLLRASLKVEPPDAIQLACAACAGIDMFVTNDRRLAGKQVGGINFIVALQDAPF